MFDQSKSDISNPFVIRDKHACSRWVIVLLICRADIIVTEAENDAAESVSSVVGQFFEGQGGQVVG